MKRMAVYEQWLLKHVLSVGTSRTLLVTQSETVAPNYRDAPPPYVVRNIDIFVLIIRHRKYAVQPAWHQWWIASICGAPEVVLPGIPRHALLAVSD